jgi:hypothetical protein
MSGERAGDGHDGGHPVSASRSPAGLEATSAPAAPANNNPLGFFEQVKVERKPSHAREEWNKVRIVCTEMRHVPTGRTPNPEELREAAAAAAAVLILHFPEGPRGAEKAQKAFSHWLQNLGGEPRPAARWQAAMREIASLERDPAEPNYLTHIDALKGVDFSGIGRGLNLRSRQTAREQAKIWSALSWRKTPDGGYLLSRNNRPMARLVPNWDQQFGDGWLSDIEKRFQHFDNGCDAVDFRTPREGKAFLERWAMGISEREFRQCGGRRRDEGLER